MAAIEIANVLHAQGLFFLGTTQPFTLEIRNNGFVAGSLVRVGAGNFTIGLIEKLGPTDGGLVITGEAGGARFLSAQLLPDIPGFPDQNIQISTYDAAGAPADIGEIFLQVFKFPNG